MYSTDYTTEALEDFEFEYDESDEKNRSRKKSRSGTSMSMSGMGQSQKIAMLQSRVSKLEQDLPRLRQEFRTALNKESTERKKQDQAIMKKLELLVLLPLLNKPKTETISLPSSTGKEPRELKVLVDSGDTLTSILPILLIGGLGGSGSGGLGSSSNDSSDMSLLLLVLAVSGGLGGNK